MRYLLFSILLLVIVGCAGIVTFEENRIITKGNIKSAERSADGSMKVETHPPIPIPDVIPAR